MSAPARRRAALVVIGNEILSGRTADVNLNRLARRLREIGVDLREARVVRDEEGQIVGAVRELRASHDLVFTSGGIGPTHDDITTASVAKAFGVGTEVDPRAREILESYYAPRGESLTPARLKMATVPSGAELIPNRVTGAPAYRMENVYVLAGVPAIFAAMLEEVIGLVGASAGYRSRTARVKAGESLIAGLLADVQGRHPSLDIGSYPRMSADGFSCDLVVSGTAHGEVDRAFADLAGALDAGKFDHAEVAGEEGGD